MDGVARLALIQRDTHCASDTTEIFLDVAGIEWRGVEVAHGLAAERIGADAGSNGAIVAQARRHDGEVRGRPAKLRPLGQQVPQELAETHDALTIGHADLGANARDENRRTALPHGAATLCPRDNKIATKSQIKAADAFASPGTTDDLNPWTARTCPEPITRRAGSTRVCDAPWAWPCVRLRCRTASLRCGDRLGRSYGYEENDAG